VQNPKEAPEYHRQRRRRLHREGKSDHSSFQGQHIFGLGPGLSVKHRVSTEKVEDLDMDQAKKVHGYLLRFSNSIQNVRKHL
jgi:hypothetical protein